MLSALPNYNAWTRESQRKVFPEGKKSKALSLIGNAIASVKLEQIHSELLTKFIRKGGMISLRDCSHEIVRNA